MLCVHLTSASSQQCPCPPLPGPRPTTMALPGHPGAVSDPGSLHQARSWPHTCRLMSPAIPTPGRFPMPPRAALRLPWLGVGRDRPARPCLPRGPQTLSPRSWQSAIMWKWKHRLQNGHEAAPICSCWTEALMWNCAVYASPDYSEILRKCVCKLF